MTHLSKQYLRIAAKWPIDKNKSQARNYRYFLEKQISVICGLNFEKFEAHRDDKPPVGPDQMSPSYHDANLRALRELTNNEHKKHWPAEHYTTGIFGLKSHQLREANSEAFRKTVGFSKSRWQKFKSMFSK